MTLPVTVTIMIDDEAIKAIFWNYDEDILEYPSVEEKMEKIQTYFDDVLNVHMNELLPRYHKAELFGVL